MASRNRILAISLFPHTSFAKVLNETATSSISLKQLLKTAKLSPVSFNTDSIHVACRFTSQYSMGRRTGIALSESDSPWMMVLMSELGTRTRREVPLHWPRWPWRVLVSGDYVEWNTPDWITSLLPALTLNVAVSRRRRPVDTIPKGSLKVTSEVGNVERRTKEDTRRWYRRRM